MNFETIDPPTANERLQSDDWTYVDVRSVQEYGASHPEGAFNVPVLLLDSNGMMAPNESFIAVMEKAFEKDAKLILGCEIGRRSMHACQMLAQVGFTNLANMHGGFGGAADMRGWRDQGFPVTSQLLEGRDYASLSE